ncbi:hypothetical protein SAMN05421504_101944 [Amycolatopsis xylanica]|uniref:Uncharacterized protein n=1 Tax=Amycolatopsis xylanica TaxID=589385 RepID=A0A1H2UNU1_9PSEU|nr:hypothetical protein [Amycolatopsis xylanica]SDW57628.1 hypothetical protein SAMN05421504_101944 [Amycolatopsis xylanica]
MRRWVRYRLPVLVCVDSDDRQERHTVTHVVIPTPQEGSTLELDPAGEFLIYDQNMRRTNDNEVVVHRVVAAAENKAEWPPATRGRRRQS